MSKDDLTEYGEEYVTLKKQGWRYLWRGLIFLSICLVVSGIADNADFVFTSLISESAVVMGWVAMWRPAEIFLYELPDLRHSTKV